MAKRSVSAALCTALALAGSAALTALREWQRRRRYDDDQHPSSHDHARQRRPDPLAEDVPRPGDSCRRVCITTYKVGHFCVAYASGDTPADVLTQQLRQRGFKVQTIP